MDSVVIPISQWEKLRFQEVGSLPGWKEAELIRFECKLWDPDI